MHHKQETSECFWRNTYHIFHCGIYTQRVAGFHALVQHIMASAVNPYKETGVSVGKMCHFSSFIFSLLLTTLPHQLLASVKLKRYRDQLCKKRNFQTTQVKLFTLTLPVSLISFPQHSEVQSQPPCVNSAGAPAPADNSTKDFHQSETLMALFEGDIKRKKAFIQICKNMKIRYLLSSSEKRLNTFFYGLLKVSMWRIPLSGTASYKSWSWYLARLIKSIKGIYQLEHNDTEMRVQFHNEGFITVYLCRLRGANGKKHIY